MALSAAVGSACKVLVRPNPKVVIAAYGCPDLVSAIRFAGAEPCFVDMEPDRPWINLGELEELLAQDSNIVAVLGVDLFGISERWAKLRDLCAGRQVILIQDCAQSLQSKTLLDSDLKGDFVVLSFGRGKPVFLGEGGVLLASPELPKAVTHIVEDPAVREQVFSSNALNRRLWLYNFLLQPHVYYLLSIFMGRRLGETRYKVLTEVRRAGSEFEKAANSLIETYWVKHTDNFREVFSELEPVIAGSQNLLSTCGVESPGPADGRRYLRLPLLVKSARVRDDWISALRKRGVSATTMYKRILPQIIAEPSSPDCLNAYPAATRFANQLITLPVHSRLDSRDIKAISDSLREVLLQRH